MIWIYVIGPFCLGAGLMVAGFRPKDKAPKKKWAAMIAVSLILIFSLCMFLTPLAGITVNIGEWLVSFSSSGGWKTVVGTVIIGAICFALGCLIFGVVKDIAKDGRPDGPTFVACMVIWIVAGLTFGVVGGGPVAYDEFTAEVMKATAGS